MNYLRAKIDANEVDSDTNPHPYQVKKSRNSRIYVPEYCVNDEIDRIGVLETVHIDNGDNEDTDSDIVSFTVNHNVDRGRNSTKNSKDSR